MTDRPPRSRNDSVPIENEFGGETDVHYTPAPPRKPNSLHHSQVEHLPPHEPAHTKMAAIGALADALPIDASADALAARMMSEYYEHQRQSRKLATEPLSVAEAFQHALWCAYWAGRASAGRDAADTRADFEAWYRRDVLGCAE